MAKNRTEKCCYCSGYGGGWITAHQYITEIAFAKFAKATLPEKFWELEEYKKGWSWQAKNVAKLLKAYHPEALIDGLRDSRLNRLKSLHAKASFMWKRIFDYYQKVEETKRTMATQEVLEEEVEKPMHSSKTPRPNFKPKKSMIDKLNE